jgi:hypothetical protein
MSSCVESGRPLRAATKTRAARPTCAEVRKFALIWRASPIQIAGTLSEVVLDVLTAERRFLMI